MIAWKKKEEIDFLVIYLISEKIDPKKTVVHMFVLETFYKNLQYLKFKIYFKFCKNWLVVCT